MTEHWAVVVFATALMSIDLVNAFCSVRLSRRIAAMEDRGELRGDTCVTCRTASVTSAEALRLLTVIVSRHTEEFAQMRALSNERQSEILGAIYRVHDDVLASLETRFMPRGAIEAALRDLYNRTTARDPDAEPRVDTDVP